MIYIDNIKTTHFRMMRHSLDNVSLLPSLPTLTGYRLEAYSSNL